MYQNLYNNNVIIYKKNKKIKYWEQFKRVYLIGQLLKSFIKRTAKQHRPVSAVGNWY